MNRSVFVWVFAMLLSVQLVSAQTIADGIKNLYYEKNNTALDIFKKLYNANNKDPQNIYWYGQAYLSVENIAEAKKLYQQALQSGINSPWVIVGMAHVEMHETDDLNSIKQKWEQAISMSIETKGKNKGKPNAGILNAIGRANAEPDVKVKDHVYAIDKLQQAAVIDPLNADIMVNLGINYLKMGSDQGGDAVKAFQSAIDKDPKNAFAHYRIGSIYYSQNNKDLFEMWFEKAIVADPAFPLVYYRLYDYYSQRDVNKAKEYLDKYIANADQDPNNDFYLADYLFRAGKYTESLAEAKKIEASPNANAVPRLNILLAYDYDRLGDSINAKSYAEKFFAVAPANKIELSHYDLAVKVFSKFPGNEKNAIAILEKAIAADTSVANKIEYYNKAADVWAKAKVYDEQLKWLRKAFDAKAKKVEFDYYKFCDAAYKAKAYNQTMEIAKLYIANFPDKPQGYTFNIKSAKYIDTANSTGLWFEAAVKQNEFLILDTAKNKQALVNNYYTMLSFYNDVQKDYAKSLEVCDNILALLPNEPQTVKIRAVIEGNLNKKNKAGATPAKPSATKQPASAPKK